MALLRFSFILNRLSCNDHNLYLFRYLLSMSRRYTSKSSMRNNLRHDAVDIYTENLLQETTNKWNRYIVDFFMKRQVTNQTLILDEGSLNKEQLEKLTVDELQNKIMDSISNNNINNVVLLIQLSKEKCYCLHGNFVIYLIKLFAKLGNKNVVETLLSLYKISNANEFDRNCGLKYYTAQVLWYSGNMKEAFEILESLYLVDSIKRDVNFIIYDIICSAVVKNEASLVLTTDFAQMFVHKYNNYYPISILWKKLTESEWFADHQLAKQLLNNNKEMAIVLSPLIPLWCVQLIHRHKIDSVHKMSEVLLENNCVDHYSSVLHSLFDYYYMRNNLKLCSAVVKSAVDLDIPLKNSYQKRFLLLLTNGKQKISEQKTSLSVPKTIEHQINFKF